MKITAGYLILLLFALINGSIEKLSAQKSEIYMQTGTTDKRVGFAVDEIKKAAAENGLSFIDGKSARAKLNEGISVIIISDSAAAVEIVNAEKLKMPRDFGWQCYSIRSKKTGNQKVIYVLSGDNTGAMYGGLDISEAIRLKTINYISDSDNKPYIDRRGIKWNMPLDLRTPNYADNGDHYQANIPVIWELDFWYQLIDEMARNRLNLITIHSENPFPSIVKIPEFPEIALNDVWRTKAKFGLESSSGPGRNLVTPEMLGNYEVVKQITINEKVKFWRHVMEYAHNLGIEFIWFTWNIFTYGIDGKYGIDDRQDNENTIKYYRSAVRELVLTYPHLSGIGITAGENMQSKNSKYSKEEWLWKTYGQGICDALKKQPEREVRLIHRFHQTNLQEILKEFKDYPGPFDLSFKYSGAHMYSIPDPPFIKSIIHLLSPELKTFLTVRNDDIYSFRWGNPMFARQYILSIPEPEKIAGFYVGGYWGKDFIGKDDNLPHQLSIHKRWYETMLWGRLGYNPDIKDSLFLKTIESHFKDVPAEAMMNGWSAASMIFPWITRFSWGGDDYQWFPEACYSNPDYKGFKTVQDFMQVEPQPGSNISSVIRWAQNYRYGRPDSLISPVDAADTISRYARLAQMNLQAMPVRKQGASDDLNQTLGDIAAFSAIGNYYAEKIRGSCSLALFNFYGLEQDREEAVQHLQNAKNWWTEYAAIYDSQYKPALFSRIGFINVPLLIEKAEQDIQIARDWQPGSIK